MKLQTELTCAPKFYQYTVHCQNIAHVYGLSYLKFHIFRVLHPNSFPDYLFQTNTLKLLTNIYKEDPSGFALFAKQMYNIEI